MFPNPQRPSVMSHSFSNVPRSEIPRSSFQRPYSYKATFDAGDLIPIYADEALPGDTFQVDMTALARLNTLLYPLMDNMYIDIHFFFVPNRLLWENWVKFMGERKSPADSIDYTVPIVTAHAVNGWTEGSLGDYFGIPTQVASLETNALHFRAYNLIYQEWYKDQNLIDAPALNIDDGPDAETDYVLLKRNKRHDYFTSCLPWPQKGDAVDLPLGSTAPVVNAAYGSTMGSDYRSGELLKAYNYSTGAQITADGVLGVDGDTAGDPVMYATTAFSGATSVCLGLEADLSSATAATINSLREAFQLQRMLERDARSGTRYTEIIRSHFRIDSPDQRLQRPEFLGGSTLRVDVSAVANTGAGFDDVGKLSGVGAANGRAGFTKSFTEHGVILGIMSARADLTYQQGLDRMWSRQTRYDFYWPALAHLGEQEVLNKEIYADGSANDDDVFGYQERWAEYRYKPSKIVGALRSNAAAPLDAWHLSQDFGALPLLNQSFIEEAPPVSRVVAVDTEPDFVFDSWFKITCTRPMPIFSVPGLIDHF